MGQGTRPRGKLPVLGLLFWLAQLSPAATAAEDLLFHYQLAVRNDPKLAAAKANRDALNQKALQSEAAFFPTVSATAARTRTNQEVDTRGFIFSQPAGRTAHYSNEYRLSLSQPLFHPELSRGNRVANADLLQAEAQHLSAYQELIVRTAQAYFDVLLAQETLSVAIAEKEAMSHQQESAKARLNSGLVPVTDVHDAEAGFQNALSQEIGARNQLADKREALTEITGQRPGELAVLAETLTPVLPDPADIEQWTRAASEQNPAIKAAAAAMESARETIARSRAGHYPTLHLVGSIARDNAEASIPGPGVLSDNSAVGLELKFPLYQGGLVGHRIQEAAYRYEAARQDLAARRRTVERATRSAFQSVTAGIAKIEALRKTVNAAAASRTARSEGYRTGLHTTLDVLNITRDLSRARRDLAEGRYSYALGLLQLEQAAGTLSEEDVMAINRWLAP